MTKYRIIERNDGKFQIQVKKTTFSSWEDFSGYISNRYNTGLFESFSESVAVINSLREAEQEKEKSYAQDIIDSGIKKIWYPGYENE